VNTLEEDTTIVKAKGRLSGIPLSAVTSNSSIELSRSGAEEVDANAVSRGTEQDNLKLGDINSDIRPTMACPGE